MDPLSLYSNRAYDPHVESGPCATRFNSLAIVVTFATENRLKKDIKLLEEQHSAGKMIHSRLLMS